MNGRAKRLHKVYAKVPALECKGLCTDSCTGISMRLSERKHLLRTLGGPPVPHFLARGFQGHRVCPLLRQGRCTVYHDRPMICRLYGVVADMPCPHGCQPARQLTNAQGAALLDEVSQT